MAWWKESNYSEGNEDLIPGSGIALGEGNGNPLQYSSLENPMDIGASPRSYKRVGHDLATKQQRHKTYFWWLITINKNSAKIACMHYIRRCYHYHVITTMNQIEFNHNDSSCKEIQIAAIARRQVYLNFRLIISECLLLETHNIIGRGVSF